jgi:phospho-N-acetylmuramoyl-pentapeptide-transferase
MSPISHSLCIFILQHRYVDDTLIRCFIGFFLSTAVGFLLSPKIFASLKRKKLNQIERGHEIVRDLADLHKSKNGTPTMGGLVIFLCAIIPSFFLVRFNFYVILALFVCVSLGILGFVDDFLKFSRQNVRGVSWRKKLAVQFLVSCVAFEALYLFHGNSLINMLSRLHFECNVVPIFLIFVLIFFVISGTSNAVNLTDGLDGLASVCIVPNLIFFGIAAYVLDTGNLFSIREVSRLQGIGELSVMLSCFCGSALVFLWYNAHPASIIMGDTGALMLGGLIGISALMLFMPFSLLLTGIIFVIEALSDIIQVGSMKLRHGERVFLMAPLHHHFELSGISEPKIVFRAGIVTFIATVLCLVLLFLC